MSIQSPLVFWITGLSGSGKTTLAKDLADYLKASSLNPIILDGDQIREIILSDASYDRDARLKVANFNSRLCRLLALQGQCVICPTISLFKDVQKWNRKNIPGYVEIFIDAPIAVLRQRDPKGIYSKFESDITKNVVGLDIKAEMPERPDFRLTMDFNTKIRQSSACLLSFAGKLIKHES